jgi:hypothetical protein
MQLLTLLFTLKNRFKVIKITNVLTKYLLLLKSPKPAAKWRNDFTHLVGNQSGV